ncbi:response regulator transcription factor [Methylotuvimicrobium buryatense]|uniref:Response regulator transcription factor n=1 Tax=Methylotuvimicrobium buryatense TaxID=95641 RepID=A0A4P9USJ7_METBY|nr:response regulator transcription factor [Methylotuvimicrobium buryatense]QCW84508.1 response regulator transcription factor [Methylotuvimicrobium buryatense]
MIKVLLVDDHAILREGLKLILADSDDIEVVGEASDGMEALRLMRKLDIHVMVMDMTMPGRSGLELLKQIKSDQPKLPVLILSMHSEEQYAIRAYKAGASGYLTKESASTLLVSAIRKAASGGIFISPASAERMAMEFNSNTSSGDKPPHTLLSDREFQIFKLLADGQGLTEIANRLSVSVKTISTHKTHILQKMQLTTNADLIRYAIKHQLLDMP